MDEASKRVDKESGFSTTVTNPIQKGGKMKKVRLMAFGVTLLLSLWSFPGQLLADETDIGVLNVKIYNDIGGWGWDVTDLFWVTSTPCTGSDLDGCQVLVPTCLYGAASAYAIQVLWVAPSDPDWGAFSDLFPYYWDYDSGGGWSSSYDSFAEYCLDKDCTEWAMQMGEDNDIYDWAYPVYEEFARLEWTQYEAREYHDYAVEIHKGS